MRLNIKGIIPILVNEDKKIKNIKLDKLDLSKNKPYKFKDN